MGYPLSVGKHADPSATEPSRLYDEDESVPQSVVLCFQPPVYEYAREAYDGSDLSPNHPRYSLYSLAATGGTVGVVGYLGIGGPATARVLEELVACGVETFVIVGHAGSLQRDVGAGDVVVVDRALRDEGTSYHYLEPARSVDASQSVSRSLVESAEKSGETVHVGTTWTIDAMFRQTVPEVRQHAADGVLTVDMEAASAFAVAKYRGVEAGAAFVVSDYVGPENWEIHLSETWPHLERVLDWTVEMLSDES